MGPVSSGRGGTNIAHIDNGVLIHDNPSALTVLKGKRVEADFDFLSLSMNYRDPANDEDGKDILCVMPSLCYAQELDSGRFGVGFGVYYPAGFSTEYNLVHGIYGRQKYASEACLTKILFGFGWKMTDAVSLGIAAGPAYSEVKLEEPYTFQTHPVFQGNSALIDMEGDAWAIAWNIGAQWKISPDTTIGVAYHYQDKFEMRGNCDLDVTGSPLAAHPALAPHPTVHYSKAEFDFTWPQSLGIGITHRLKGNHRLSADVKWIDWTSAFDEVTFKLSSGDNAGYDLLAGDSAKDTYPLDWKDSYSFCLGYEYLFTMAGTVRFGYVYNKNPVPDSTLVPVIPGILEHLVSVGYGRNWENWTFDVAYQYSFGSRQSVGTSKILGADYDNSSVDIDAHLLALGIQYHF